MPYQAPGLRHKTTATKVVNHGDPVIENGFAGSAFKTLQLGAFVNPASTEVRSIAIGEELEIELGGVVEVAAAKIAGGLAAAPVGTPLYIVAADNSITPTASTNAKFGRVTAVETARSVVRVNTNAKDSF